MCSQHQQRHAHHQSKQQRLKRKAEGKSHHIPADGPAALLQQLSHDKRTRGVPGRAAASSWHPHHLRSPNITTTLPKVVWLISLSKRWERDALLSLSHTPKLPVHLLSPSSDTLPVLVDTPDVHFIACLSLYHSKLLSSTTVYDSSPCQRTSYELRLILPCHPEPIVLVRVKEQLTAWDARTQLHAG